MVFDPQRYELSGEAQTASPGTLRYYEKLGFIEPTKDSAGYRNYSYDDLELLNWIACLKKSGMTLDSIKRYVQVERYSDSAAQVELLDMHLEKLFQQQEDIKHYVEVTQNKLRTLRSNIDH